MFTIFFTTALLWASSARALNMSGDFAFKYERAEIISWNSEYMSNITVKNYKFNRTQAVSNMTFTVKKFVTQSYKIEIQAYRFMSNEYRQFPIRFSYNFCECLAKNDFGARDASYNCGNLSRAGCPLKKGTYQICMLYLDGAKFPPHIPAGNYMFDVKWFDGPTEMAFAQSYGSIKYKSFWLH